MSSIETKNKKITFSAGVSKPFLATVFFTLCKFCKTSQPGRFLHNFSNLIFALAVHDNICSPLLRRKGPRLWCTRLAMELDRESRNPEKVEGIVRMPICLPVTIKFLKAFDITEGGFLQCLFEYNKSNNILHMKGALTAKDDNLPDGCKIFETKLSSNFTNNLSLNTYLESANRTRCIPQQHVQRVQKFFEENSRTNQHAFAVICGNENRMEKLDVNGPDYKHKDGTKHTEEMLIENIDEYLKTKKNEDIVCILIYTYNSPCLHRGRNFVPCMFQLLVKAQQWKRECNCFTAVFFSKCWGPIRPSFWRDNPYILDLHTGKHTAFPIEKELFTECMEKINLNQELSKVKKTDRNEQKDGFLDVRNRLRKEAENGSDLTFECHVENGGKVIHSSPNTQLNEDLKQSLSEAWNEIVAKSEKEQIKALATEQLNSAIVNFFIQNFENIFRINSPLTLYAIP